MGVETVTVETNIPGRLDRLPWSKFHCSIFAPNIGWRITFGLEAVLALSKAESEGRIRRISRTTYAAPD